jgi:hypothetical protein
MRRLCAFLFLTLSALAQEPDVRLRLTDITGQTQFRIGQTIVLTLTFDTTGANKYSVLASVRPRNIRPQTPDQFTAEPATGWVDPLKDLQWTMDAGVNSALPQGDVPLDAARPVTVKRELNEFIVFRKPGHYVVHCISSRLLRSDGAKLESNGLALDILPRDDAEDARQFASARATLETGKPPKEPERVMSMAKESAQTDAVRVLRDLDTEAAAVYLASIYGQGRHTERDIEYALYASEHREAIVRELERHLADPDLTPSQSYLITLSMLQARLEESKTGHAISPADWNALDETIDKRVFELAAAKTPQARADTYFYLFEVGSKSYRHSPGIRRLLLESFASLSPFSIEILLCNNWGEISDAGPQLLPFLKQAVSRQWMQISPSIPGLALLRLAEFDQRAANDLAREALLAGNFSIDDSQLLEFPIPPSPEVDQALLSQYRQGKLVDARIARFAGADLKDQLWRAYDERLASRAGPECATPLLAYFFRVDPAAAASRVAQSRKAQAYPCMALQFNGVERALMSPGLERQLLQDIQSSVANIRMGALQPLSMAGSAAVLPQLLEALDQSAGAKQEIITAILQGRNWFLKDPDYAQLKRNCAGTSVCQQIDRVQRESAPPYALRLFDFAGHQGVWLSNHEVDTLTDLDEQLNQYPAGATFRWQIDNPASSSTERSVRDRVQALLAKHGMRITL